MITQSLLDQIRHIIKPLQTRVANSIARAVIQNVSDSTKMQMLQLGVLEGETVDDCERFQEYGFNSVPLTGAEAVVIFPNGDRGHPLVVAVDDRRYRPTDLESGQSALYDTTGTRVLMADDGTVLVGTSGGVFKQLVTKDEYDLHLHPTGVGPSGVPTVPAIGTVIRSK